MEAYIPSVVVALTALLLIALVILDTLLCNLDDGYAAGNVVMIMGLTSFITTCVVLLCAIGSWAIWKAAIPAPDAATVTGYVGANSRILDQDTRDNRLPRQVSMGSARSTGREKLAAAVEANIGAAPRDPSLCDGAFTDIWEADKLQEPCLLPKNLAYPQLAGAGQGK